MRSWSIPAGHILGIEVRIHLAFLLLLLFVLGTESVAKGADQAVRALGLVVIIFGSCTNSATQSWRVAEVSRYALSCCFPSAASPSWSSPSAQLLLAISVLRLPDHS